ncbi:MAG: prepilin-type N-terminal cleavage/methylation domain-containing protein [Armatimonadota bacterium]|nr:DUF1559 domain-containing protein [bacterium]
MFARSSLYKRSSGFTLIELLVVIAIIAILAAILFPVFLTAKVSAQRTQCASNMKQIGLAFNMYADSWDGALPHIPPYDPSWDSPKAVFSWETYTGHTYPWNQATLDWIMKNSYRAQLTPYVKNGAVFACPGDKDVKLVARGSVSAGYAISQRFTSYHYRPFLGLNAKPISISGIAKPSKLFLIHETIPFHDARKDARVERSYPGYGWIGSTKWDLLFADGHTATKTADSALHIESTEGVKMIDPHDLRHTYGGVAWGIPFKPSSHDLD